MFYQVTLPVITGNILVFMTPFLSFFNVKNRVTLPTLTGNSSRTLLHTHLFTQILCSISSLEIKQ
jgi:hypothetical protein